ncbi:MAG: hypothetical protein AAF762_08270 [Pseudomonadota bacterium]
MAEVRDDATKRVSALRALEAMLEMARTNAREIGAEELADAIERARRIAEADFRTPRH